MIRVALRGVRAHVVRFVLSVLAVTLGVAFVVGTFAFRGMLSSTFDDIIATTLTADVYVRGSQEVTGDATSPGGGNGGNGFAGDRTLVPADLAADVEAVDGVARAVPDVSGPVVLVAADGTAVVTTGPPSTAFSIDPEDPSLTLLDGAWPGPGEIVLEQSAAETAGLGTGDATTVVLGGEPTPVTVSGVFGIEAAAAGAVLVGIDGETAREAFAPDGMVPQLSVWSSRSSQDVDEDALAQRVGDVLPDGAEAVTGEQARAEASEAVEEVLGFVETFLLVFAAIALFVGAFIIANTFAMSVRERLRELALLRALGASPGQVFTSVLVQAFVVGLVGGGLGVLAGAGLVRVIRWGLALAGMEFSGRVPLGAPQVVAAVGLGAVVSLLAAVLPARRAAAIPPVQAMRDDVAPDRGTGVRAVGGVVLVAAGAGVLWLAAFLGSAVADAPTGWAWVDDLSPRVLLGVGAGLVLVGVLVGSPAVARGVLTVLAWPLVVALRPLGRLARGNVTRNPRRTASTAGALLIGMALVSVTGVIAASTQASVRSIVENEVRADLVVDSATLVVPDGAVDAVTATPGAAVVDTVRLGLAPVATVETSGSATSGSGAGEARGTDVAGVPAGFFDTALDPVALAGDPTATLEAGDAVVHRRTARERGWEVGDALRLGEGDAAVEVRVGAVIDSQLVGTGILVRDDVFDAVVPAAQASVRIVYVSAADGASAAQVDELRAALTTAVEPFLVVTVLDREDTASAFADQVNQVLVILYALLALSIVIALLGIVNTLALSIIERTREIGLLRAVGLGRLQLAGVIAIESVLTAVYGTVLGVATGIGIGAALPGVLADEGLSTLAVPWGQVLAILGVAVVIGLVASVWPAIRAARLPVLDAVTID
ncbi:putative ABC transport system permease protein [Cellulosimicrobium cellulans]|uniref:ABC transporter permease n=1 Tax=Cellulosimicrobium cellulans TaxID=1710 RepID=UPI001957C679|nr:FtsX-like permease family protein [Cellulosimicrobium cellulans]MBM7818626.1 putative ABC transport system permease protein [Cellulosimicrobium cellulans]